MKPQIPIEIPDLNKMLITIVFILNHDLFFVYQREEAFSNNRTNKEEKIIQQYFAADRIGQFYWSLHRIYLEVPKLRSFREKMMKMKLKYVFLLILGIGIFSCNDDDDPKQEPHDPVAQAVIDDAVLIEFLQTNFFCLSWLSWNQWGVSVIDRDDIFA